MLEKNSIRSAGMQVEPLSVAAGVERLEKAIGIERGHAAGARRGHRLAVHVVGHVAGGKYARYAGRGRFAIDSALYRDVAATHGELPLEERRVGSVAD